ncbi:hypothetical protein D3C85_1575810 [compost metagenome]
MFGDAMTAEVDTVVNLHQRDVEMPLFGRGVCLQFRLELLVRLDPLRRIAAGMDQRFCIGPLAFVAFTQGFKNVHGVVVLISCVLE